MVKIEIREVSKERAVRGMKERKNQGVLIRYRGGLGQSIYVLDPWDFMSSRTEKGRRK